MSAVIILVLYYYISIILVSILVLFYYCYYYISINIIRLVLYLHGLVVSDFQKREMFALKIFKVKT